MWPWEHLAVAYVCYSLFSRVVLGRVPSRLEVFVVAFTSQLPDLVDKPLAWAFDVLPSGATLAHSVFVAAPGSVLALGLAVRYRRPGIGVAVAVGWLTHLLTDVLYPVAYDGSIRPEYVLWPLVPASPPLLEGLVGNVSLYGRRYVDYLLSPDGVLYLAFELALLVGALVLWLADGAPGLPRANSHREQCLEDSES